MKKIYDPFEDSSDYCRPLPGPLCQTGYDSGCLAG